VITLWYGVFNKQFIFVLRFLLVNEPGNATIERARKVVVRRLQM
jgi:hypothetical protein